MTMSSPDAINLSHPTLSSVSTDAESCPLPSAFRNKLPPSTLKPLSSAQERRLTTYVDEQLLVIQREYKKREYESSTLRTVDAYIEAVRPLLTVVLLIPPIGPSTFLRSSLLLRLTGEILDSITGYIPATFDQILDILSDLDRGWVAVLRSQKWNAEEKIGEGVPDAPNLQSEGPLFQLRHNSISQTDRARLRSLLSAGMDNLEEWIEIVITSRQSGDRESAVAEPARSVELLESMRVQQSFDDLFTGTLAELGELHGSLPLDLTDSENDEYELV